MEKQKEKIIISNEKSGTRIDKFLAEEFDLTRTRIQNLIKDENILVNGKKTKASYKIEENDEIEMEIPKLEEIEIKPENIEINIVYEDEDLAIINKNAGMVVHPAHGHNSGTLVNAIMYHIKDLSGINGKIRPGIVHRLDKDTSGLIIIAKNDKSHLKLSNMFSTKEIKKTYLTIVKGKINKKSGRIVTNIGRNKLDRKKMAVVDATNGKNAITNFEVLAQNEKFSFVKVNIETGRTHQIRVHMKSINHVILGDSVYGTEDKNVKRQMLHAYKLEFLNPLDNKEYVFKGKLFNDFIEVAKKLKFNIEKYLNK